MLRTVVCLLAAFLLQPLSVAAEGLPTQPFALKWKAVEGAGGYRVEIEDSAGSVTAQNIDADTTSVTLNLVPGPYQLRLTTLNRLMKDEQATEWQPLHIAAPSAPVISGLTSQQTVPGEDFSLDFSVTGLAIDGSVALRSPSGKLLPLKPVSGQSFQSSVSGQTERGDWDLVATNPPQLTAAQPALHMEYPVPRVDAPSPLPGNVVQGEQEIRVQGNGFSSELVVVLTGQGKSQQLKYTISVPLSEHPNVQLVRVDLPPDLESGTYKLSVANADEQPIDAGTLAVNLPDNGTYAKVSTLLPLGDTPFWYGLEAGSMAVSGDGTVYFSGNQTNSIYSVSSASIASNKPKAAVFMGKAKAGDSDGGPLGGATFNQPRSVAVADDGTLYVGDTGNRTIRRITPDKTVTTWGSGQLGFDDGKGKASSFLEPVGLVVDDDGLLWVVDKGNNLIRRVDFDGTVTTLGLGTAKLDHPISVVVEASGFFDVLDGLSWRIRRFGPDGTVATLAEASDGGPLVLPRSLTQAPDGSIIVADGSGHRIWDLSTAGKLTLIAGQTDAGAEDGLERQASFDTPSSAAIRGQTLYVVDLGAKPKVRLVELPKSLAAPR